MQTMTEAEKARAFDVWLQDYQKNCGSIFNTNFVDEEATIKSHMGPIRAVAAVIAGRKPNLAPWTPEDGDSYYYVGWAGDVDEENWMGHEVDIDSRDFGNVFRTHEDAKSHAKLLRVFNRVCQMRRALWLRELSPSDIMERLFEASDDLQAIRRQLEKEGVL